MKPRSWIGNLFARRPGTKLRAASRRRATVRLCLQACEDRILPAPALLTSYDGIDEGADAYLNVLQSHFPPDANAAIGTDHTVAVVNDTIEIKAKDNSGIPLQDPLFDFFGTGLSPHLFDPKVLWDRQSQRFFVVTMDIDNTSRSMIHLAVSPTGDPSDFTSWQKFSFDATETINGHNTWADYPGFGVDSAAIYITANKNDFPPMRGRNAGYEGWRLWIVNKAALINGTLNQTRYAPSNMLRTTMQPAQMYSDLPTGPGTFLTGWTNNALTIIRVANPLGTPTFTTYGLPTGNIDSNVSLPGAPQQDSSALLDTGDQRIVSTVWSHGQLYAANTVDPPSGPDMGRATAHWYRIDTTDLSNLRLADQGNIDGAGVIPNLYTYYPAVTVDDAGNIAVGFSGSAANTTRASAFYTTRLAGDPPGYTEPIAFLRGGDDWYNQTLDGSGDEWGDYSGAGLDPDGRTFLFFNEYAGTRDLISFPDGRWVTHYGTTRYANHYRLVTAGGVTTVTTDNSVDLIRLSHSGSSTQVLIDGVSAGTTTAATVAVNLGWGASTQLAVDNSAGGTYTVTGSQLVTPGLTVNVGNSARNLNDVRLSTGVGSNVTVVNTLAGPGHGMTLEVGPGMDQSTGTVNVLATTEALVIFCRDASDDVSLGNANSLAGITGPVSVGPVGSAHYQLAVNDGADNANHPNVALTATTSISLSLTGLAPAPINAFGVDNLDLFVITVGNGNNTYTVDDFFASSQETRLNAGAGNDTVNVQATYARLLTINLGGGGNDVVNLGKANSVDGIAGAVAINAAAGTRVNVNASADNFDHPNVTLSATGLTGLARAAINFGTDSVTTLIVTAGNGANAYTISGTPGTVGTLLNTGAGTDTVNVQATTRGLGINVQGGGGNDVVNLGNANSVAGIAGGVGIYAAPARSRVNVNDGSDNANHPNVMLTATGLNGLTPPTATIAFGPNDLNGLTITVGNGNNTYTVANTQAGSATTLNTGAGADTVNVQATSSPLTVNTAGNNNQVINLGNAGTLAGITAAVTVNPNSMFTVNVNDGSDNANHPAVVIAATGVTGLAPAPLNVDITHTGTLNVTVGNGADAYRITETPRNALNLTTGTGTNTVTVAPTGNRGPIMLTGNRAGVNALVATNSAIGHITGADAGNFSAGTMVSFTGYGSLTGGSGSNTFVFSDGASLSGTLDGGSGGNNILDSSAYSTAESFTLTGTDAGTGTPVAAFVHIQNLIGAAVGGNYFQFADGATLHGTLTGGSGGGNTLDLSASTANLTVRFSGTDGNVAGVVGSFRSIQNVTGGSGANIFVFSDGAVLDGTLNGGSSGSNTLDSSAYSTAESFTLTGTDAGTGTPVASFVDIQNVNGAGGGGSYFQFADGAMLDGNLAGGGATLDYSAYTTSVVVDLQPTVASATGVGGSISGFTTVIGASGAPGTPGLYNLLIGSDVGGDTLQGGFGRRNILVAGGGASTLIAGDGEDLLIGGSTAYDTDPTLANWLAIADYWAGPDDFATRSANLQSGNGVPLLDATTVTGNGGGNVMQGNGGIALIYTDGQDAIDSNFANTSLVNIAP